MEKKKILLSATLFPLFFICSAHGSANSSCNVVILEKEDHNLILPVEIESHLYRFILDTGLSFDLTINKDLLEKLHTKSTSKRIKYTNLEGKQSEQTEFQISEVKVGGSTLKDIHALEHSEWAFSIGNSNNPKTDGFAGAGLFKGMNYAIDSYNKKIFLGDLKECFNESDIKWFKTSYTQDAEGISFRVNIFNKIYKMVIDTGLNISLIKRSSLPKNIDRSHFKICDYKMPNNNACQLFLAKEAKNKQLNFPEFLVYEFKEPQADAILGDNFLINYIIFFDQNNKQLYFHLHQK